MLICIAIGHTERLGIPQDRLACNRMLLHNYDRRLFDFEL